MSDIRQTPNSNVQSVTINYPSSATGQNPQLQIFNSPGGSNSQIQFNAGNGKFAGSSNMIWNNANRILNVLGTVRASTLQGKITTNLTNFKITGGNAGDTITTDGTGNLTWVEGENYTNVNVASFLVSYTGNITANNLILSNNFTVNATSTTRSINANGNITANFFIGNAFALTSLTGANVTGQVGNSLIAGTVYTNAQPNITSVGTLNTLSVLGNLISGNANLGNVVQANFFVGDGSLLTGLPEQYANSNVANYLPTYTGNLSGDYVTLTNNVSANIVTANFLYGDASNISNLPVGNIATINLDGNSNTVLYGNGVFSSIAGGLPLANGNSNFNIPSIDGNATITANANTWSFNDNGTLGLADGNSTIQSVPNSAGDLSGLSTMRLTPDNTVGDDRYLIVDPTGPNHIHIRPGGNIDNSNSDFYLGGEKNHVRISDSSSVVRMQNQTTQFINSYNFVPASGYSSAAWQNDEFGGYLIFINAPTPDVFTAVWGLNQYSYIDVNDGVTNYTLTVTGSSSTPGGGPITFGVNEAPPSSPTALSSIYIELNQLRTNYAEVAGSDFTVSVYDDVRITGNDIVTLRNRSNVDPVTIVSDYDNVEHTWSFHANSEMEMPGNIVSVNNINLKAGDAVTITSNNTGTINTWQFDETGLLTLPSGNVTIGSQFGAQAIISNNEPFGVVSQGNAGTILQWMDDISNTSVLSAVYINAPGGNVGDIQLRTGDISSPNVWTFAADGTLTIPSSISGTGASPAPSLFGFDSLDAISINASGNMSAAYFIGNGSQLTGLGNVSTVNLDGNASNILYGNGSFASAPSGGSYGNSNVVTLLSSFGSNTISTTGNISVGNINVASVTATANISTTGYFISGNQATGGFQLGNSNSRLKAGDSNSYMTMGQNPAIYPDTAASATAGVLIGGSGYLLGNNGSRNITLNYGGSSGIVGLQANVQVGTSGSGTILVPGTVTTGVNSILAGPTFTPLPNTMAGFVSNVNSYTQLTIQNKNAGADATTDFIATADNGSDTVNYLDLGIINSGYDANTPTNSLGNIVFAADSYLYAQGNTGNASQSGGNLAIGTTVAGKSVKIFAGGANNNSIVATISNTGANITGNLTLSGNIIGSNPNVSLVAGSYTATFDNTGKLNLPSMGGDEGGEINFGIPTSNTTLTTRVVFDVFQDRIRFFDGSTKGVYIDLSQAATGVSTLLNNRVSGYVNAGVFVTMDNIKATVTTSGNRALALATVSGSFSAYVSGVYAILGGSSAGTGASVTVTTSTGNTPVINWNFAGAGDTITYIVNDTTNSKCYRITLMIGGGYNSNMISIERLI